MPVTPYRFSPHSFLDRLDDAEQAFLLSLAPIRKFPRRSILLFQDDLGDRIVLLTAGRVKVSRLDAKGREVMLSIRDPGDLLGEISFIDGDTRTASVTALEPVEAILAPVETLRECLNTHPRVAVVLLETVTQRFREINTRLWQLGAADALGRLSARIVELAERYGVECDDGILIESSISQEDLAAWSGCSRAALGDALRSLRTAGWLRTGRNSMVVLDIEALRARAA